MQQLTVLLLAYLFIRRGFATVILCTQRSNTLQILMPQIKTLRDTYSLAVMVTVRIFNCRKICIAAFCCLIFGFTLIDASQHLKHRFGDDRPAAIRLAFWKGALSLKEQGVKADHASAVIIKRMEEVRFKKLADDEKHVQGDSSCLQKCFQWSSAFFYGMNVGDRVGKRSKKN